MRITPQLAEAKRERLVSFDIAKAICIILVVVGHYSPDESPEWYMWIHDVIYIFHMPLFMFASGYIYNATRKAEIGYGAFLLKKIKRLMIPYFVTSVIIISIKLLTQSNAYVENPVTWGSYIAIFYSPSAGYFLWFVWALWWMFVVVPLFKTRASRMVLCFVALLLAFLPVDFPRTFCLQEFKAMFVYFMLGCLCCDFKQYISFDKYRMMGITLFTISLLVIGKDMRHFTIVGACLGILMVMQLSKYLEQYAMSGKLRWLMQVSVSSYIIYLFHTTFEGFAKSFVHKIPLLANGENELMFTIGAIIVICCGVIIPIILHKYVLAKSRVIRTLFGLQKQCFTK